jgi:hypothetical protein
MPLGITMSLGILFLGTVAEVVGGLFGALGTAGRIFSRSRLEVCDDAVGLLVPEEIPLGEYGYGYTVS